MTQKSIGKVKKSKKLITLTNTYMMSLKNLVRIFFIT